MKKGMIQAGEDNLGIRKAAASPAQALRGNDWSTFTSPSACREAVHVETQCM